MTIELRSKSTNQYVLLKVSDVELFLEVIKNQCTRDTVCRHICIHSRPTDDEIRQLLRTAIVAVRQGGSFPLGRSTGRYDLQQRYENVTELARAAVGVLAARKRWKHEFDLACWALASPAVSQHLDLAVGKLLTKIKSVDKNGEILAELAQISRGPSHGTYECHFKLKGRLDVLTNPQAYTVARKIIALHDMMEYLQAPVGHIKPTKGTGQVSHPRPTAYHTSVLTSDDLSSGTVGVLRIEDRSRGKIGGIDGLWTRNEQNSSTVSSRVTGTPIWAGQSMTTARMLDTLVWAGVGTNELTAVSIGIFAFWRVLYDKSISPVHTYHEVMDVAKNYGVHYIEFDRPNTPAFIPSKL